MSNLSFLGIMYTIFVAKSWFVDESHFFAFLSSSLLVIEVMKYVVANSLGIMQK